MSGKGLLLAQEILEQHHSIRTVLVKWSDGYEKGWDALVDCEAFIWGLPIHNTTVCAEAYEIANSIIEKIPNRFHTFIVAAGSPYFYMASKDFLFKMLLAGDGVLIGKPLFICEEDIENQKSDITKKYKTMLQKRLKSLVELIKSA